jgi:catechol 2,3-dioxygenase-like lactoylglutathione lyase family enzyme
MSIRSGALSIERIGLTVADLAAACAFYEQRLGFRKVAAEVREGDAFAKLVGVAGARAEVAVLQLGAQAIELVEFATAGRPYPNPRTAADPWFQHFAIVTADMDCAYQAVSDGEGAQPISTGGPQVLPPASGSVTAYKFRDPEGHPLELSYFPPAVTRPVWRDPRPGALFLGVDHSGIAVSDIDVSTDFYARGLGLNIAARQVNKGPEQDRLDGLSGAELDIVSLTFPGGGPHIELLAYHAPKGIGERSPFRADDIAATRLIVRVRDLAGLVERLREAAPDFASNGVAELEDGALATLIRDPDGHLLELHESL